MSTQAAIAERPVVQAPLRQIEFRWVKVGSLRPHPKNSRRHGDKQVQALQRSLREFGIMRPIVVDETDTILAGHGVWMAAKAEGFGELPTVMRAGMTDAQKRAFVIADNKLAEMSTWDDSILRAELGDLRLAGFDMSVVGFGSSELNRLFDAGTGGSANEDNTPDLPDTAVSRRGDLWQLGQHFLMCGDSTSKPDVEVLLALGRPALMATDPPYGVAYDPAWRARAGVNLNRKKLGKVANDDRADWREAWALFPGDVAYVWHGGLHAGTVQASLEAADLDIRAQIIWVKDRFALSRGDYHWQHEPCWYAVRRGRPGRWAGDRSQSTTWEIPAREDSGSGHGTQKPVECMRRPMINSSQRGQFVYDPFIGSGTTIIAAQTCERRCLGIDIDPRYVDVAIRRWQEFVGKGAAAIHIDTGLTYDALADTRQKAAKQKPRNKSQRPDKAA